MDDFEVRCSTCNSVVNEEPDILPVHRKPCSNCGALGRRLPAIVNETVNFNDHYLNRLKRKDPKRTGKKKLRIDSIEGDQINHDSGKWIYKEWWIDKDHIPPWYFEKITDTETDKVIRFRSEPLPKHIGHGSDKRKKIMGYLTRQMQLTPKSGATDNPSGKQVSLNITCQIRKGKFR